MREINMGAIFPDPLIPFDGKKVLENLHTSPLEL